MLSTLPESFAANTRTLRAAFFGTSICQAGFYKKYKNVQFYNSHAKVAGEHWQNCRRLPKAKPNLHGHFVLETFLNEIEDSKKLLIIPINVFDNQGKTNKDYWLKAFKMAKKFKADFIFTASSFPKKELGNYGHQDQKNLSSIPAIPIFTSSGQIEKGFRRRVELFPQGLEEKNIFHFGHFIPSLYIGVDKKKSPQIFDPALLYKDKIKLYFSRGTIGKKSSPKVSGSSRALAIATARLLNFCYTPLLSSKNLENLNECIDKNKKPIIFSNKKGRFWTLPIKLD